MKNLQELKFNLKEVSTSIEANQKLISNPDEYEGAIKALKKLRKQKELLDLCIRYIETNPTEEFVCLQLNEQIRNLEIIDARFETWFVNEGYKRVNECSSDIVSKKRQEYNSLMKRSDVVRKIKTLEFLEPQQKLAL